MTLTELFNSYIEAKEPSTQQLEYVNKYISNFKEEMEGKEIFEEKSIMITNMKYVIDCRNYYEDKPNVIKTLKSFNEHICIEEDICKIKELNHYLYGNTRFYQPGEICERMVKYLQNGYKKLEDIAIYFGVNIDTIKDAIRDIETGKYKMFLRTNIQLIRNDKGEYTYSVHPLCYASNLTEVVALTVGLKELAKGSTYEAVLNDFADETYGQLSSYAKEIVDEIAKDKNIGFSDIPLQYKKELEKIVENPRYLDAFCAKKSSNRKLIEIYLNDGNTITGTALDYCEINKKIKSILVITKSGTISVKINEIMGINWVSQFPKRQV